MMTWSEMLPRIGLGLSWQRSSGSSAGSEAELPACVPIWLATAAGMWLVTAIGVMPGPGCSSLQAVSP